MELFMKTKTLSSRPRLSGGNSLTERGHSGPMPLEFHPHPEGIFDNNPTFQRWVGELRGAQVPKGRLKPTKPREPSVVPSGLIVVAGAAPNVETLGYFRMSLRDNGLARPRNHSLRTNPR